MLINLRNALMTGKKWKNPYVTDGLLAMWDGEWNAGGGVHIASTSELQDLSGNGWNMALSQAHIYSILDKGILFARDSKKGTRAGSQLGVFLTDDLTVEATMLIPTASPVWSLRMCAGLLYGEKSGMFPFARGPDYTPALKYTAAYADSADRYFRNPSRGSRYSATIVFHRADKSFDGYYNGSFVASIGSQTENWIGDTAKLSPVFVYNQTDSDCGTSFEVNGMRIYSRALTADEIAANYAIDKARFGLP